MKSAALVCAIALLGTCGLFSCSGDDGAAETGVGGAAGQTVVGADVAGAAAAAAAGAGGSSGSVTAGAAPGLGGEAGAGAAGSLVVAGQLNTGQNDTAGAGGALAGAMAGGTMVDGNASGAGLGEDAAGAAGVAGSASVAGQPGFAGAMAMAGMTNAAGSEATGGAMNTAGESAQAGDNGAAGAPMEMEAAGTSGEEEQAGGAGEPMGGEPLVRVVGRTETTSSGERFAWPGVHFVARFSGTEVSVDLSDGSNANRFTVVIDGGTPQALTTSSGQSSYSLASGLAAGEHEVVLWRNTESYKGVTEFRGFNFGAGGEMLAASSPDRRIEVIGDSISVGAGVEGTNTSCNTDDFTNNYKAYGSVAARALSADVVTIAYSGIGVSRSYNGAPVMSTRYDHAVDNNQSAWDFSRYQPHVVLMNLGTNDYSGGDPGSDYETEYVKLIEHVRNNYTDAQLLLLIQYQSHSARVNAVVAAVKSADPNAKIESLELFGVANESACASHPNEAGQRAMGEAVAARLQQLMGW